MGQMKRTHFETMARQCDLNPKMVLAELQELSSLLPKKAKDLSDQLKLEHPSPVYERIAWEIGRLSRQICD